MFITVVENDSKMNGKYQDSVFVFCGVETAIGSPAFSLSCSSCHPNDFRICQENTTVELHDTYVYSIHHAIVHMSESAEISCNVSDDLGTYVAGKSKKT